LSERTAILIGTDTDEEVTCCRQNVDTRTVCHLWNHPPLFFLLFLRRLLFSFFPLRPKWLPSVSWNHKTHKIWGFRYKRV